MPLYFDENNASVDFYIRSYLIKKLNSTGEDFNKLVFQIYSEIVSEYYQITLKILENMTVYIEPDFIRCVHGPQSHHRTIYTSSGSPKTKRGRFKKLDRQLDVIIKEIYIRLEQTLNNFDKDYNEALLDFSMKWRAKKQNNEVYRRVLNNANIE